MEMTLVSSPAVAAVLPAERFAWGTGCAGRLDAELAHLAPRPGPVLVVADRAVSELAPTRSALHALAAAGFAPVLWTTPGEPRAGDIDAARERARRAAAVGVVGIGGGSALDTAKLAAVLAAAGDCAARYATAAQPLPARTLPLVLIPTTAGTGSEATTTAVFAGADGRKLWAWGPGLRPDRALLDPVMTASLPPAVAAATGADALVHAMEAHTARRATPEAQHFAHRAIALIAANLVRATQHPEDEPARTAMLVAAALAGLAIDRAGTGVAHALGHALGGLARIHHGRAVSIALRAAVAWNANAAPQAYARLAPAFGLEIQGDARERAAAVAAAFKALLCHAGLDLSLAPDGLTPADAPRVAAAAMAPENAPMRENNARALTRADLEHLATEMLSAR